MPDLDERLRGADDVSVPELWERALRMADDGRPLRPLEQRPHRLLSAVVAIAIAAVAFAALLRAFSGDTLAPAGPELNGAIVTLGRGGDRLPGVQNTDIVAIDLSNGHRLDLTPGPEREASPVWSPDGTRVAFLRTWSSGPLPGPAQVLLHQGLFVMNADGSGLNEVYRCPDAARCDVTEFAWSPNDRYFAWTISRAVKDGGSELRILDTSDGSVRRLCQRGACGEELSQLAWSPVSADLTFTDVQTGSLGGQPPSSIWNVGVTGGRARLTAGRACLNVSGAEPCYADSSPAWSPDGTTLAFLRSSSGGLPPTTQETWVVRINLEGMIIGQTRLCEGAAECYASPPLWSPDGSSILFGSESVHGTKVLVLDPTSGQITDVPIETGSACASPQQPSWSPDGKLIAFIGGPRGSENLCTVSRGGGLARVLVPTLPGFHLSAGSGFTWLPAGAIDLSGARPARSQASPQAEPAPPGTIVFASSSGGSLQTGDEEIWSLGANASDLRRLTSNGTADSSPRISPDGTAIAFVRHGDVCAMNVDGSRPKRLTNINQRVGDPEWSPDGTHISFEISSGSQKEMEAGIYVMRSDGSHLRLVMQGQVFGMSWGDAGTITYSAGDADNLLKLFDLDLATGATRPFLSLPGEQTSPVWSPDGSTLAFGWNSTAGDGLYLVDADGSNLREVVGAPFTSGGSDRSIAWSPDGSWLAFEGVGPRNHIQIYEVRADGSGLRRLTGFAGTTPDNGVYAVTGDPSWGP